MASKQCYICKLCDVNELELGEFLECNDIHVHYFCLLLTTRLEQNGEDEEGLLGFLVEDIKKCVKGLKKNICYICYKPYANIECTKSNCSRKFHTPCGLNRCLNIFTGKFNSFCGSHYKTLPGKHKPTESCAICYDVMNEFNPITSIQPKCCKGGWMHKKCVAHYAKNSGYFCKCPFCNNDNIFRDFIVHRGVFIPDKDAAWELEPNAYSELLERPRVCQATHCKAPRRDLRNKRNKMKTCVACGSYIAHIKCWDSVATFSKNYICENCNVIVNNEGQSDIDVNHSVQSENFIEISDDERSTDLNETPSQLADLKRERRSNVFVDSISDELSESKIKELRNRKIIVSAGKQFNIKQEIRQSLDSSCLSSTSECTSTQNVSKSEDFENIKTRSSVKKRKRILMPDSSDDSDWGTNVKRFKSSRLKQTICRPKYQRTRSHGIFTDISNNNGNSTNACAAGGDVKDILQQNKRDVSKLSSKTNKKLKCKQSGMDNFGKSGIIKEDLSERMQVQRINEGCDLKLCHSVILPLKLNNPDLFLNNLGISINQFYDLLSQIESCLFKQSFLKRASEPFLKLAVTLRYLITGDSVTDLAAFFKCSATSVYYWILATAEAIIDIIKPKVFKKINKDTFLEIAKNFEEQWNFPHCVGVLGTKNLVVQALKKQKSCVLMIICDHEYNFLMYEIAFSEKQNIDEIFRNSDFGKLLYSNCLPLPPPSDLTSNLKNVPFVFVADDSFGLDINILKSYSNSPLSQAQMIYNCRISAVRRISNNCLRMLTSKWRVLEQPLVGKFNRVEKIIGACVCLHNWLHQQSTTKDWHISQDMIDSEDDNAPITTANQICEEKDNVFSKEAEGVRLKFVEFFNSVGNVV